MALKSVVVVGGAEAAEGQGRDVGAGNHRSQSHGGEKQMLQEYDRAAGRVGAKAHSEQLAV